LDFPALPITSATLAELTFLTERAAKPTLESIHANQEELQPRGRRFLVARMGGTGSAWFAKLLNSHPDVSCSHEGVAARVFPEKSYAEGDILRFVRWLAWDTMHGAYESIGDIGSIWQAHAAGLEAFRTAMLVRHPARVLASRIATYPHDQSFTDIGSAADIRELWNIDIDRIEATDRVFLHDIYIFASHIWSLRLGVPFIHIEELSDPEQCHKYAKYLTGLDYPANLVENAIRNPVNQRVKQKPIPQVVSQFTARQREWYGLFLRDAAPELGYDLAA
jgi:hypothetical protein